MTAFFGMSDERVCAALTRRYARTFSLASALLPAPKRRACFALYTFCRRADDIVDALSSGRSSASARDELVRYRSRLAAALAGRPDDAAYRELAWAVARYRVTRAVLDELLDGVARDLTPPAFATWGDLACYSEGVASSVGEMCVHVFGTMGGPRAQTRAVGYARTLGVAMQLTNILRDVGEDARHGRCYLPHDDLARFGYTPAAVLQGRIRAGEAAWQAFMRFQIARARSLYDDAQQGIALLAPDARRCARACAEGYAAILGAIEDIGYEVFAVRARVTLWRRTQVLLGAWLGKSGAVPRRERYAATS
ncbi:MAG: phytoene/squalene synthase family protein [Gemmatimonadaceae bacterium]